MLVWVRKLMGNWVARVFFSLLVLGFVFWGVSNVLTLVGGDTNVAKIGNVGIDASVVQAAYQKALEEASQSGQGQPDVAARQQMAAQALADAVRKQVMQDEERRLGLVAPDSAVRQLVEGIPDFQTNGVFDKAKFAQVLQQNNSSPDAFLAEARDQIAARQLILPLLSGAGPSDGLLGPLFSFIAEQRVAQSVAVPVAGEAVPADPGDAMLQRYWRNHPAEFTAPEYRRIKLVILAPAVLAPSEQVAPADVDAAYARAVAAAPPSVAQRSVQVLAVGNLAASSRLEAAWKHGASWAKMQALAKAYDASAVELDQAAQTQIPAADLAQAVFAAAPGKVTGPVAGAAGMYVFKVTATGQSGPDAADVRAQVLQQLQLQKAQADVAQYVDGLQDALAGQTPLDQLPGNLGLTAVQGTLDANGDAPDGTPAPIPGGDDLKSAIVQAVFAARQGDPAQLMNGPGDSYFAFTIEAVQPPALQAFAQVRSKVLSAWQNDAMLRTAETKAAGLLHAVDEGQSLQMAAAAAGLQVSSSAPVTRTAQANGTDPLTTQLFTMKLGQATMLQTNTGFTVAVLAKIIAPDPAQDPSDYQQLRQAMTKALQDDTGGSFLAGLQTRDKVSINQKILSQIYQ